MSILENNCMQSTATAAGSSTGATMVSAISAYLIITGHHISWHVFSLWTLFLAALGVFHGVPMKRQMINIEQLLFPSRHRLRRSRCAACMPRAGKRSVKARSLGIAGLIGIVITWLRDARKPFGDSGHARLSRKAIVGIPMIRWTLSFEVSSIMMGGRRHHRLEGRLVDAARRLH